MVKKPSINGDRMIQSMELKILLKSWQTLHILTTVEIGQIISCKEWFVHLSVSLYHLGSLLNFVFQDMMVLLDLLGASDPSFYSYFSKTDKWYKRLVNAEDQLAKLRLMAQYSYGLDGYPKHRYFNPQSVYAGIEDDHVPFDKRGGH